MKPRYKRRIWWGGAIAAAILVLAAVFAPSFITLNNMRQNLESEILTQTGIPAKIQGDIKFSWLGGIRYVANDVQVPNGVIENIYFPKGFSGIKITGANLTVSNLIPPKFDGEIAIHNSIINFQDKDYFIIKAELSNGMLRGTVRTDQHKYDFDSNGDVFHIKNSNQNLDIIGNLYSDGSAHGTLVIETHDANKFFDFTVPKLDGDVNLSFDFDWDGFNEFKFSNMRGIYNDTAFTGEIDLPANDTPHIRIASTDADIDLSFLLNPENFFAGFNGTFSGRIKLWNREFDSVVMIGNGDTIRINVMNDNMSASCAVNKNIDGFVCDKLVRGNTTGRLSFIDKKLIMEIQSPDAMPANMQTDMPGTIVFKYSNASGVIENDVITFDYINGQTLREFASDLEFLPDAILDTVGDFSTDNDATVFTPKDENWTITIQKNKFFMFGKNIKDFFPNIDLQFTNDMEFTASGSFMGRTISNFELNIAQHLFSGTIVGDTMTLHTQLLNIDTFTNQDFVDNYDQLKFLMNEPVITLFDIPANISLSADTMIYNGDVFTNFVYLKKNDSQTFSITDSDKGSLLVDIIKRKNEYAVRLRLDRFRIGGAILDSRFPINVNDTLITASAGFETSGKIAVDIWENLTGNIDATFTGGQVSGIGLDKFYENAPSITTLNAEYAISAALDGGVSNLEKIHLTGKYNGGDFETDAPLEMSLRHTDAIGILKIENGNLSAKLEMVLRGTAPQPAPISLSITNAVRNYSLSQIMQNFDPDFMREFTRTHNMF